MKVFDTHAHLDDEKFDADRDFVLAQCRANGVELCVNASSDLESSKKSIALSEQNDFIYAMVGVHPHEANTWSDEVREQLCQLAEHKKVVAVGEIGLDYYYHFAPKEVQRKVFAEEIQMAHALHLPVVIHDRDAHEDTMRILKEGNAAEYGCLIHSFSGSVEMARECIKSGYYLAIGGILTFKNNRKTVEVVKSIPLEYLFIETDSPYLTPVPYRGHRNYPGYVIEVAKRIAELKGISTEEVAKVTMENAKRFFGIQ